MTNAPFGERDFSWIRDDSFREVFRKNVGLAEMLCGGVIMDVTDAEQAKIAEAAGACAVMALERVPSDIRKQGGIARMSPVEKVEEIQKTVSIPVMAKCRIGHFSEGRILEHLKVDFIDESEVLTPADHAFHIDKSVFTVPFVCGATCLDEALRRIGEGAAMIRTKGSSQRASNQICGVELLSVVKGSCISALSLVAHASDTNRTVALGELELGFFPHCVPIAL